MKPQLPFILVTAVAALLTACSEPPADLSEQKTHESGAIRFDYPTNWRVSEDVCTPEFHYLFVETPGDALAIFQSYPKDLATDLHSFTKEFSATAAAQTPLAKTSASNFKDMPEADGFQRIHESFTISLLGESLPHWRMYSTKTVGDRQIFMIFQVAKEDLKKVQPGFELIRKTLRSREKP